MNRGFLVILFHISISLSSVAQLVQFRDLIFNDVAFRHNTAATFFENGAQGKSGYLIPASGSGSPIFASNLWFGATLPNGDTATLVGSYNFAGQEFIPGPISSNYDTDYFAKYYKTWLMTIEQVNFHRTHYLDSAYQMDTAIATWPANGRPGLESSLNLAPYYDLNNNQIYDPETGDYPAIPGDMNLFYMQNSCSNQSANTTGGKKLKLQLNGFLYAFRSATAPMSTTLFHKMIIIHGGDQPYNGLLCGTWIDADIGGNFDDLGGTMVDLNAVYAYNSDNNDSQGKNPYGLNPPAQGFMWLNTNLSSSTIYSYPDEPEKTYAPYYYYLSGKNFDGSDKFNPFDFPGDPYLLDTNSEFGAHHSGTDRRLLATTNLGTINPGQTICLDAAFVWSRGGNQHLENVNTLREDAISIRDFYNGTLNGSCFRYAAGIEEKQDFSSFLIYPNPTSGLINLSGVPPQAVAISITDNLGREVLRSSYQNQLEILALETGIYLLSIYDKDGRRLHSTQLIRN